MVWIYTLRRDSLVWMSLAVKLKLEACFYVYTPLTDPHPKPSLVQTRFGTGRPLLR